ncbi:hypothetical protein V6N12_024981 [Hibiscus sabdariffa]|uniref:Uncharacterized protein n=1 Tax=Hibiscus sabdariffa TaxID=183260 RepID=A0ABR2AWD4_9ROSI
MVSSEAEKDECATPRVVRDNPVYMPATDVLSLKGGVLVREAFMEAWDERVGMTDRELGSGLERFDVLWWEPSLEQSGVRQTVLGSPDVTSLETDLVPVPIKVASVITGQGMEVVVIEGVVQKVRSVNDLVLNTGSEEQRFILTTAKGKGHRNKTRPAVGDSEVGFW